MLGSTVSHYRLLEKLGGGGMGVVYKAEDIRLKRTVALKFLPPESTRDTHAKELFMSEAQTASALQHENICTIHDIDDTLDGKLFIVMDCYDGETLEKRLQRQPLTQAEIRDLSRQIARGMIAAHERGIVHRDLKPSNIFIKHDGVVKIFDFGLAKLLGSQGLTRDGNTAGTVLYMSPEQLRGEDVNPLADIWSFGVILYRMLSGQLPFEADYDQALIYKILCESPRPISSIKSHAPRQLIAAAERCLEKDRSLRPQSMNEVLDLLDDARLETALGWNTWRRKLTRRNILVIGIAAVSLAAILLLNYDRFLPVPSNEGDVKLAVLLFANQTNEADIDSYRPEIQNRFVNNLASVKRMFVEDGLRINDIIRERFHSDNPPRTDDLYRFLHGRGYQYVVEGAITRSPQGGYSVQVTCKNTGDYQRMLEPFAKLSVAKEQLTQGSEDLAQAVFAYMNVSVLNVKPEMGIWQENHRYENWAAIAQLDRAYDAVLQGDTAGARARLSKAIELDSTFISPRIWLTPSLDRNPAAAVRNLESLRRLRNSADEFEAAMIDWAEAHSGHDYGREVACLNRALKHDPANRILLSNLAASYVMWGDSANALQIYDRLIRTGWKFPGIYWTTLKFLLAQKNYTRAVEALALWRSVDTSARSHMLFGWLSALNSSRGDSGMAQECRSKFERLCNQNGFNAPRTEFLLGGCYADFGLFQESETMLRSALAGDATNPSYHERLGDVLIARSDTASGIKEYRAALRLNSTSKSLQRKLGQLLEKKGDKTGARDHGLKFLF